jgi:hypothetical protein
MYNRQRCKILSKNNIEVKEPHQPRRRTKKREDSQHECKQNNLRTGKTNNRLGIVLLIKSSANTLKSKYKRKKKARAKKQRRTPFSRTREKG